MANQILTQEIEPSFADPRTAQEQLNGDHCSATVSLFSAADLLSLYDAIQSIAYDGSSTDNRLRTAVVTLDMLKARLVNLGVEPPV